MPILLFCYVRSETMRRLARASHLVNERRTPYSAPGVEVARA